MHPVLAFLDSPVTMLLLGALAVILFGERLPEVARSLGKGFMEFKKGLNSIQDDIRGAIDSAVSTSSAPPGSSSTSSSISSAAYHDSELCEEPTAPKFEPPTTP
jgi:sec-independent protein translocase protein TatA